MAAGSRDAAEIDLGAMLFGVEAEFALVDAAGRLCDFETLTSAAAQAVVDRLGDPGREDLVRGDIGIKVGRWYLEGDERFDTDGRLRECVPKGLETRTPPLRGIPATTAALAAQTAALAASAAADGYRLASVGWNPHRDAYRPEPPYNAWEDGLHARRSEYLAPDVYMMSYGPDLNLSHPDWDDRDVVDVARMLTYYSPAVVPFSFSAPFVGGRPYGGLSRRTELRTGRRPAVRAFVDPASVPATQPSPPLVHPARVPAERGRVEFKAFDALVDAAAYPALLALLAGVVADRSLPGRADVPDPAAHRHAAARGFADAQLAEGTATVLAASRRGLAGSDWAEPLAPLEEALRTERTPAHAMLESFARDGVVALPLVTVVGHA